MMARMKVKPGLRLSSDEASTGEEYCSPIYPIACRKKLKKDLNFFFQELAKLKEILIKSLKVDK